MSRVGRIPRTVFPLEDRNESNFFGGERQSEQEEKSLFFHFPSPLDKHFIAESLFFALQEKSENPLKQELKI